MASARARIEVLPYDIRLREPEGIHNVLIGQVRGDRGERFRFFLMVNRNAPARIPGVPGYRFYGPHHAIMGPGLEGGALAKTDVLLVTIEPGDDSRAQRQERSLILSAIEDGVCKTQTQHACPGP